MPDRMPDETDEMSDRMSEKKAASMSRYLPDMMSDRVTGHILGTGSNMNLGRLSRRFIRLFGAMYICNCLEHM